MSLWMRVLGLGCVALGMSSLVVSTAQAAEISIESVGSSAAALRYELPVGAQKPVRFAVDMDAQIDMGKQGDGADAPKVVFVLTPTVVGVENGFTRVDLIITSAEIDQDVANVELNTMIKNEAAALVGRTGVLRMDSAGVIEQLEFKGEEVPTLNNLRVAVHHAITPLPVKPIGEKAKWIVDREVDIMGVSLGEKATYHFDKRVGDVLHLQMQVDHRLVESSSLDGLPPGTKAMVAGIDSKGSGVKRVHLDRVFPESLELVHDLHARILINQSGNQAMSVGLKTHTNLDLTTP